MPSPNKPQRAIALQYDESRQGAPVVTASGSGEVARKILQAAQQAGIHIQQDPDLVELLARVPVGAEIPPELYQTIADILAYIYFVNDRFKKKMDGSGRVP